MKKFELKLQKLLNKSTNELVIIISSLYKELNNLQKVADNLGCSWFSINNFMKENNIQINKPTSYFYDYTGETFGCLEVLNIVQMHGKSRLWKCKCDCGNIMNVTTSRLKLCMKSCQKCSGEKQKGKLSSVFTGFEEISGGIFGEIKRGALRREIIFEIDIEYIHDLWIKQNRTCALSNKTLSFANRNLKISGNASLDRIDSNKGYVQGNVWWVDKNINVAKQRMSTEKFIKMCEEVVKHNKYKDMVEFKPREKSIISVENFPFSSYNNLYQELKPCNLVY